MAEGSKIVTTELLNVHRNLRQLNEQLKAETKDEKRKRKAAKNPLSDPSILHVKATLKNQLEKKGNNTDCHEQATEQIDDEKGQDEYLTARPLRQRVVNGESEHTENQEEMSPRGDRHFLFGDVYASKSRNGFGKIGCKSMVIFILVCVIVAGVIGIVVWNEKRYDGTIKTVASALAPEALQGNIEVSEEADKADVEHNCNKPELKPPFRDIDYAYLGYNILKGIPQATGHDPGFTYPIFKADYSSQQLTADCRYRIPKGLVIMPDVSCVTSFTSIVVQNKYELSKSLSTSAYTKGEIWGLDFSLSTSFKRQSKEMRSGKNVYIFSTANCNYYFSKVIPGGSPDFDDVFLQWVYRLNNAHWDPELYVSFFEMYGTHFPVELTFGARFTFEYKMSKSAYENMEKTDFKVSSRASLGGFLSLFEKFEAGFDLSTSRRQDVSEFKQNVETRTITVGAVPPANGTALQWASEVKDNPVPTAYSLSSIENLFTEQYMKHLNIDYERIRTTIGTHKSEYCAYLRKLGKVDQCEDLSGLPILNTRLSGAYKQTEADSISDCIEICLEETQCEATSYCTTCKGGQRDYIACYLYKNAGQNNSAMRTTASDPSGDWQSNIYSDKIENVLVFNDTKVVGAARGFEKEVDKMEDYPGCRKLCIQDAYCVAFSHCRCEGKSAKCQMYGTEQIQGLLIEKGTNTTFISSRLALASQNATNV